MIRIALALLLAAPLAAQSVERLEGKNVAIAQTTFKGRSAIQVVAARDAANAASMAIVKDASFQDGTIEVELAGLKLEPRAGGVALWVGPGTEGYFSNLKITAT